jgi:hypothetical protein
MLGSAVMQQLSGWGINKLGWDVGVAQVGPDDLETNALLQLLVHLAKR